MNNPEALQRKRLSLFEEAVGPYLGYELEEEGLSLLIGRFQFFFELYQSAAKRVVADLETVPHGRC